ncbi:hypothetical protein XI03_00815 [Bradyrhizobium sp. CCBAU 65884]|uniref:hypothetical protein n=1 Tax=Bradyrhizobium sp. CCBAU 65884 TaxID=722477 RepID=UPI002305F610|nr:hypothetical protein [Bradyrhizobium sp. CCBAU 65884]MDA9473107.1 hypothetical protein [Bradyrhizobium sp. CCBAU 65884]
MKLMTFASVLIVVFAGLPLAHAQRINCNHDPVCQAKRDGTSVDEARKKDQGLTSCLSAVGYTQADWRAYKVPAGPATKVRACLAKKGLPTN